MEDLVRISFDIWSALLAFGMFQGVLMIIILFGFRRNTALYSLIGLILILVLNLFNHLLLSTNLAVEYPHMLYVFTPTMFLIGPLYHWHIMAAIDPLYKPRRVIVHFIPLVLSIILLTPFYSLGAEVKVEMLESQLQTGLIPLPLSSYMIMALQIILSFIYIYWTSKSIVDPNESRHPKRSKQGVGWLRKFGLAFSIYWAIDFIALTIYTILGAIQPQVFYMTMLGAAFFINALVIFIIRNHKEFNLLILNPGNEKYRNSPLSEQEVYSILDHIYQLMEAEKPYLDPELSLTKFASLLNKTSHQVSEVLNSSIGKSFYEFINEYRFKEAKSRLQSDQYSHLTILAIAFDSGFNNKNTFNRVFKELSGKTPSQFLKEI